MKDSIRLTYIFHDCFLLQSSECSILFDYWRDPLSRDVANPLFLKTLDRDLPFYVIVSHHHKDHFTKAIFEWSKEFDKIRYIISKDVERNVKYVFRPDSLYSGTKVGYDKVTILRHGETYTDNLLTINAFGSTDIGNSYMIEHKGIRIFHSGDLNAWIWKDESTDKEIRVAINNYTKILSSIKETTSYFDIAMFPVDSRIGTDYWEGAKIFTREFKVSNFFPMHFELADSEEELINRKLEASDFDSYANQSYGEYIALQAPYSVFYSPLKLFFQKRDANIE